MVSKDNKLEKDEDFLAPADPSDQRLLILDHNFRRNREVRNLFADWAEHCDRVSKHSYSGVYTQCPEYFYLPYFGPSIVAHIMVEYKKRNMGAGGPLFWYELLHEIMWGHKTGQQTISMQMQYEMWSEWFEKGNHDQAPHYLERASSPE